MRIPSLRDCLRAAGRAAGVLASALLAGAVSAQAATVRWTGAGGDGRWSTAANWNGGAVPGGGDVAVVSGGCDVRFDAGASAELGGFVLDRAFSAAVRLERDIAVAGGIEIAGGTLDAGPRAVRAGSWRQSGGVFAGGAGRVEIAGAVLVSGGRLEAPAALVRAERMEIRAPGLVRMAAKGKLELSGGGAPLVGDGLLDTTTNGGNSVEYTGHATASITDAGPMSPLPLFGSRCGAGPARRERRAMPGRIRSATVASDSVANGFAEVSSLALEGGEDAFDAAVIDSDQGYAYFASYTSPAHIVKIRLSDFTRVGALTLNPGEDFVSSAVIDPSGGYAYFGTDTSPGIVVAVDLSDFTHADALTLDPGENELLSAVIDPGNGFAYFGTESSPSGVVVKLRLSDFTRVGSLSPGAGTLVSAVIDTAAGYAYFGSWELPYVTRVRLSDFTLAGVLVLDSDEAPLLSAVIDPTDGFAYFGCDTTPGIVVKVSLSDFTRAGALTLNTGEDVLGSAVLDANGGVAYFGTNSLTLPGMVVAVRLSDFTRVAALTLDPSEVYLTAAVIDSSAGTAYFGTYTWPGQVVKVSLSDLTLVDSLACTVGEDRLYPAVRDPAGQYAYFGTWTSPGVVIKVRLADFTRVGALTLGAVERFLKSAVIDNAGQFAYFGTSTAPGNVIKIDLTDFTYDATLTLDTGEDALWSAVIDGSSQFAYFCTNGLPGIVVQVRLSDFSRVGALTLNSNEGYIYTGAIDPVGEYAYFGSYWCRPGLIVKVRLSDLSRVGALRLNYGEDNLYSSVVDPGGGYAYFGTYTWPATVIEVRLSDFTRVGALALFSLDKYLLSAAIDPAGGFAYFGTATTPGRIVKVRLSDFSHTSTLALDSGEGPLSSSVIDPTGGYCYFGTDTSAGQVLRIDLGSTTTAVQTSASPSQYGDTVTFTATVSPLHAGTGTPSGTVDFSSDGAPVAGCAELALSSGQAQCSTSAFTLGDHAITAAFTADASWSNSTGSTTQEIVNPPGGAEITSADHTSFTTGVGGSFTVTSTGSPLPALSESGVLPAGAAFTDNGDGTATLAGTPAGGAAGTYPLTLTAHNGVGSDVTQIFTLTVQVAVSAAAKYYPLTPCRLVDTRHGPKDVLQPGGGTPAGFPRGSYVDGEIRSYDLTSSTACTGLPAGVTAWSLLFQFTTATQASYLQAWPYASSLGIGNQAPASSESTMLGYTDRWTANSAIIPAGNDANGSINVLVQHAGDVIVEVNGYFK